MVDSDSVDIEKVDQVKRSFLKNTSVFLGAIGAAGVGAPLIGYLSPNNSTKEAGKPVTVDISAIKVGDQKTVLWRSKPVWIIRRSESMLASLDKTTEWLKDPDSKVPQQPGLRLARGQTSATRPSSDDTRVEAHARRDPHTPRRQSAEGRGGRAPAGGEEKGRLGG